MLTAWFLSWHLTSVCKWDCWSATAYRRAHFPTIVLQCHFFDEEIKFKPFLYRVVLFNWSQMMTNDSWTGHYLCSFPHVKCWAALFRCSSSQTMSLQRQGAGCAGLPSLCCRHCTCWTARLCKGALGFVSGLAVELEVWLPVKVSWLRICEKQPHAVSLSRVLSWIAVQSSFMRVTASVSANM